MILEWNCKQEEKHTNITQSVNKSVPMCLSVSIKFILGGNYDGLSLFTADKI